MPGIVKANIAFRLRKAAAAAINKNKKNTMMESKPLELYEFLVEAELQQYYNSIKNDLKTNTVAHLKYTADEDLKQIGLSRPEIRRLRKFYEKVYPNGYLSKIKRLLQNPVRKEDGTVINATTSIETIKVSSSPSKIPNNKHIIPSDSICVHKQLGIGEFGIVQQGVWTNGTERIQVAIKCLTRERMLSNPMEFLKEAAIMHSIEHENIVRLYGVVLDTESLMLVTELAHLRSLAECLKDSGLRVSFLTVPTLCEFAYQICNGMLYLENKRLIHRDLAARNVLVFSKNTVKISDFGLSRALGVGKDYYQTNFNINLKLPIAWCAPECINFLRFTNASDVWAFGVCLWELFSYGFQPWAALNGQLILEAIDEPNYQRLEAPECCPREYYNLMLKCWQHDPLKRPKFSEIYAMLPDMKPEQLKTILEYNEPVKNHLVYRQSEIICVLDKSTNSPYWKGVLNSGKTGFFNPANTVTYLGSLPSSTNPNRDSFCRTADRSSKRKLRTEMISKPQNDLKHTGHVGLDGAYFGDVAFLSSSSGGGNDGGGNASSQSFNHVPRQIVTPYKPSEDIEQTPLLLPPTPTSPDSLQTASGYFPENIPLNPNSFGAGGDSSTAHNRLTHNTGISNFGSAFSFNNTDLPFSSSNPFHDRTMIRQTDGGAFTNTNINDDDVGYPKDQRKKSNINWPEINVATTEATHEYHEISDDEMATDKVFDLGPSLLDEMDFMFRSMNATASAEHQEPKSPDFENTNKKNEITELTSKMHSRKNMVVAGVSSTLGITGKSKKKGGTVKPISVKDERILNQAIDYANEISARSMTDLVSDTPVVAQSPKRKFSFRFPNLSHHSSIDKDTSCSGNGNSGPHQSNTNTMNYAAKGRNFSEELKNVPDLQNTITEESLEAYNSLVEKASKSSALISGASSSCALQSAMGRYDFDKPKFDSEDLKSISAATLPRSLQLTSSIGGSSKIVQANSKKQKSLEVTMPAQRAPRPTTLPHRSSMGQFGKSPSTAAATSIPASEVDSNPLRILRDKNYPIVRPRIKINIGNAGTTGKDTVDNDLATGGGVCESPSYLTNTEYSFSERDVNLHRATTQKQIANKEIENLNPIPLPPRDRNKIMPANVKRHVRKYPLIIPVSGLQRTLNKVTTPVDFKGANRGTNPSNTYINQEFFSNNAILHATPESRDHTDFYSRKFIENNFPSLNNMDRTYENLDTLRYQMQDCTDSASLHFESILEDDCNKVGEMSSPDVATDFMFEIHKDHYRKPSTSQMEDETDEIRNLDIEKKKIEFSQRYPKYMQPKNELADNVLFNKLKETVDLVGTKDVASVTTPIGKVEDKTVMQNHNAQSTVGDSSSISGGVVDCQPSVERKLEDSNSVSCEDLLEFSDKKPKGRERGVESDEVRIMTKVLGVVASPDQFIVALDFIDWDVHKAIKLIMLQKTLNTMNLTFEQCVESLQKYEWDLQTTTLKLKGL